MLSPARSDIAHPDAHRAQRPGTTALALLTAWIATLTLLGLTGRPVTDAHREPGGPIVASDASGSHTTPPPAPRAPTAPPRARPVTPDQLSRLPKATTNTTLAAAPRDPAPQQEPGGLVVRPTRTQPLYARPAGRAIAARPTSQLGGATWLPVIAQRPGWLQVLLPTRPNGATGWLPHRERQLTVARTPFRIVVDRDRFRLTVYQDGAKPQAWTIGVGKPGAVTPRGRTFILAALRDRQSRFSDIVLPLGAHSDTYTSYGGGPGTVGIHTWPTSNVYGRASSDGCVRVPRDALTVISTTVPIGTPVLIR